MALLGFFGTIAAAILRFGHLVAPGKQSGPLETYLDKKFDRIYDHIDHKMQEIDHKLDERYLRKDLSAVEHTSIDKQLQDIKNDVSSIKVALTKKDRSS